jgi:hypothetical protein
VGAFADFALNKNLVFRPGLQFIKKGAKETGIYTGNGSSHRYFSQYNFTAVDLPLNLLYKMKAGNGHLLMGGGLVPGILTDDLLNKFDAGVNVLAGYALANGLSATVAYQHGLLDVADDAPYYESLKNRHLSLVLGYSLRQQPTTKPVAVETNAEPSPVSLKPATALFAELGGPGGVPSVNFDTRFTKSIKGWGFRTGIGLLVAPDATGFGIPAALNYLVGQQAHFFEMTLGAGFYRLVKSNVSGWYDFPKENSVVPFVWLGYRYQPAAKRFFFRTGFNQMLSRRTGIIQNVPFPSFSFGYSIH